MGPCFEAALFIRISNQGPILEDHGFILDARQEKLSYEDPQAVGQKNNQTVLAKNNDAFPLIRSRTFEFGVASQTSDSKVDAACLGTGTQCPNSRTSAQAHCSEPHTKGRRKTFDAARAPLCF